MLTYTERVWQSRFGIFVAVANVHGILLIIAVPRIVIVIVVISNVKCSGDISLLTSAFLHHTDINSKVWIISISSLKISKDFCYGKVCIEITNRLKYQHISHSKMIRKKQKTVLKIDDINNYNKSGMLNQDIDIAYHRIWWMVNKIINHYW